MKTLEIRRHCLTKKGAERGRGSHLSASGVLQARHIGARLEPFDLVWTSHIPRTLETALAMGFAVDEQFDALGEISAAVWDEIGHQERWEWAEPFARFAEIIASGGATFQMAHAQRNMWVRALQSVPAGGRVLVVSHGRIIECGLVCCFPSADFASWGEPFQHGEGVRMNFAAGQFTALQFER